MNDVILQPTDKFVREAEARNAKQAQALACKAIYYTCFKGIQIQTHTHFLPYPLLASSTSWPEGPARKASFTVTRVPAK
jgi:hypothetical protein